MSDNTENKVGKVGDILPPEPTDVNELVSQIEDGVVGIDYETSGAQSRDNMKMYLIMYAESRLRSVLKLTDRLDMLLDQLFELADNSGDVDIILSTIKTMQSTLNSSIDLIQRVTTDESYMNFILNDNRQVINQFNEIETSDEAIQLDRQSREKLRDAVSQLMAGLEEEKL